jgi:hypothetical protein
MTPVFRRKRRWRQRDLTPEGIRRLVHRRRVVPAIHIERWRRMTVTAPAWQPGEIVWPVGPRIGTGPGLSDRPPRPDSLPAEALARAVSAAKRHLARSRRDWSSEQWRTWERERKRRYRAKQAAIAHLLSTPAGAMRLLEAMAAEEETA